MTLALAGERILEVRRQSDPLLTTDEGDIHKRLTLAGKNGKCLALVTTEKEDQGGKRCTTTLHHMTSFGVLLKPTSICSICRDAHSSKSP
jgi:hypothetical protein